MNLLQSALAGRPVVSLQTGQIIALVNQPIINIANLKIAGLMCRSSEGNQPLLIISHDIRQYASDCIIIDGESELTNPDDIVRTNTSLKSHYSPIGKSVIDESGHKLGAVEDYLINLDLDRIQKLYVRRSLLQLWFGSRLIVDRTQITDITPQSIVVRDLAARDPLLSPESVPET